MAFLFVLIGVIAVLAGAVTFRLLLPPAHPDPAVFLELFRTLYGDRNEGVEPVERTVERLMVEREVAYLEEQAAMVPSARGETWTDPTAGFQEGMHEPGAVIPPGMTWQEMNGMGNVGDGLGATN